VGLGEIYVDQEIILGAFDGLEIYSSFSSVQLTRSQSWNEGRNFRGKVRVCFLADKLPFGDVLQFDLLHT
jgi:hypothetical protein